jgi:hypothetical protein
MRWISMACARAVAMFNARLDWTAVLAEYVVRGTRRLSSSYCITVEPRPMQVLF